MTEGKSRENGLRRPAARQGLALPKSRRRDPRASDFRTYLLVDATRNAVMRSGAERGYSLSLDDIEEAVG